MSSEVVENTVEDTPLSTSPRAITSKFGHLRFSVRGIIVATAGIALILALTLQSRRLALTEAALARYEAEIVPTEIPDNHFRVISRRVLDADHAKVLSFRVETTQSGFVTLSNETGDSNGAALDVSAKGNGYHQEVTVLIDHLARENCLKLVPKVGGAQGYTILAVEESFALDAELNWGEADGLHPMKQAIELFTIDGRKYSLSVR